MAGIMRLSILVLLVLLLPGLAVSDLIVLNDGTQVKAQNVWEENDLVRFTLPDYDGIVVTYAKEIVRRIEKEKAAPAEPLPDSTPQKPATTSAAVEKPLSAEKSNKRPIASELAGAAVQPSRPRDTVRGKAGHPTRAGQEVSSVPVGTFSSLEAKQMPVASNENAESRMADAEPVSPATVDEESLNRVTGIQFYDPRRHYKYQTDINSRFHSLKEAVDDLAKRFDKTPRWVELNLGDTNDLSQIYRNLSRTPENAQPETESESAASGLLFYDPRRAEKYWVSSDSRHRTLEEAVNTLAQQYEQTPDWVIAHLGETNDLMEIHRNLARGAATETSQKSSGNSAK